MTKSIDAIIDSQEQKLKMMDSKFQIQDPYSIFEVSQQEEELWTQIGVWKT